MQPTVETDTSCVAESLLNSLDPVSALENTLKAHYSAYNRYQLSILPPPPPNATAKDLRRRKNSITSAACANKKTYGVSVMTAMASRLVAALSVVVPAHPALVRARPDILRARVEAAAEAARVDKVIQKAAEPGRAARGVGKRRGGVMRRAQNCATAHKGNRMRKGLYDEYLAVVGELVELQARVWRGEEVVAIADGEVVDGGEEGCCFGAAGEFWIPPQGWFGEVDEFLAHAAAAC